MLAEGTYILSETVRNPNGDKRNSTQVHKVAVWHKDDRFAILKDRLSGVLHVYQVGLYGRIELTEQNKGDWHLLVEKFRPAPESLNNLLVRFLFDTTLAPEAALAVLVRDGKITLADVEAAINTFIDAPEDEQNAIWPGKII